MQVEYKILKDKALLILRFSGEWSLDDYKASLDKVMKDPDFEVVNKVLSDFRKISSNEAFNQIKELVEIREKTIKRKYTHIRIISDPLTTVIAHLYKEQLQTMGYSDIYCSTVEHALRLLHVDMTVHEMEELLNSLENEE